MKISYGKKKEKKDLRKEEGEIGQNIINIGVQ